MPRAPKPPPAPRCSLGHIGPDHGDRCPCPPTCPCKARPLPDPTKPRRPSTAKLSDRARRCSAGMGLAVRLAESALQRHDPEAAAGYLVGIVADLAEGLSAMRRELRALRR